MSYLINLPSTVNLSAHDKNTVAVKYNFFGGLIEYEYHPIRSYIYIYIFSVCKGVCTVCLLSISVGTAEPNRRTFI